MTICFVYFNIIYSKLQCPDYTPVIQRVASYRSAEPDFETRSRAISGDLLGLDAFSLSDSPELKTTRLLEDPDSF